MVYGYKRYGHICTCKNKKQSKETGLNYQSCLQLFAQEAFFETIQHRGTIYEKGSMEKIIHCENIVYTERFNKVIEIKKSDANTLRIIKDEKNNSGYSIRDLITERGSQNLKRMLEVTE